MTKLEELLAKVFPHNWEREIVEGIKAEVSEDTRASKEEAWREGYEACSKDYEAPFFTRNPYAKKSANSER